MSGQRQHWPSSSGENNDFWTPRRKSSAASIGSNILEEIIEGAVMQEAHKVLDGAHIIQEQDEHQSTTSTSTSTTTTTTASSSFGEMTKGKVKEGEDRRRM